MWCIELPQQLCGIWEGKDRYVFFEQQPENENTELVIVLKEYYGWYLDRAAESDIYSQKEVRSRNAATHKTPEHIVIKDISSLLNQTDNKDYEKVAETAWEILLEYSKYEKNYIPVTIINNELYLDFYVKPASWNEDKKIIRSTEGQWKGNAETRGLTIDSQIIDENIGLLIVDNSKLYDVRYWLTDMEYVKEEVLFKCKTDEYYVPKHLISAGSNYSSVNGKSKKIRNTVGPFIYSQNDYEYNPQMTVMIKKSEPYLKKLVDKDSFEDLIKIIKTQNSKRKPEPPALFPPSDLDWHWDLIDMLEKDNQLIQAVRERQKQFGPRGKDLER